ncbi:MAG: YopX family protein [Candidatus Omnitrophica bacterium]|nr:YopX family protein [Candidatus Omnitrophota bacterium]
MNREIKFRVWSKETKEMFQLHAFIEDYRQREDIEIMQFTGLLDKNGKEIYEGDITTTEWEDEEDKKEVVFWQGCFCHKREDGNGHIFNPKKIEVIGNIYENPELMPSMSSMPPKTKKKPGRR